MEAVAHGVVVVGDTVLSLGTDGNQHRRGAGRGRRHLLGDEGAIDRAEADGIRWAWEVD